MRKYIHLVKRWLRESRGFTMAEMMVALAVGSLIMGGVFAVWTQMFNVTAANSNYMAAFRQVQDGGDWISRDALMTQGVYEMTSTALNGGISASSTDDILVDDTSGFPPCGVICVEGIEDELIQYSSKDDTHFIGITRGVSAVAHGDNTSVTMFLNLSWATPSSSDPSVWEQQQVVYSLKSASGELVRSRFTFDDEGTLVEASTAVVARAIDPAGTTSSWNYDEKELRVDIRAQIGDEAAIRTYRVHPRPLF